MNSASGKSDKFKLQSLLSLVVNPDTILLFAQHETYSEPLMVHWQFESARKSHDSGNMKPVKAVVCKHNNHNEI